MDYKNYQSPFSWRYASQEMRSIWSEYNKKLIWRQIWVALAEAQQEFGLVTEEQVNDLKSQQTNINIARSIEIENEIHHDLMAEIRTFAEQCPTGGGVIHLGATSMDIEDNAEILRIHASLEITLKKLAILINHLFEKITTYANLPIIAFTHIQPAEPSTLGYRFSTYAQDLLTDFEQIESVYTNLRGKGFKGAVGTAASYIELIGLENFTQFENYLSDKLNLEFYPISTQTYPRKQDFLVINALSGLASSIYKFAFDLRILQSPPMGEWGEPFRSKQVGSSAMPFKRNPINSEKLDSLGRLVAQFSRTAWDNASHSLLERTLDDSANRRVILPEGFLIIDEMLTICTRLIQGIKINLSSIEKNLDTYGPFAATERLLMTLVKHGADRQEMHEKIRLHAMKSWEALQRGDENPLVNSLLSDQSFQDYLTREEISESLSYKSHTGIAEQRAIDITQQKRAIEKWLDQEDSSLS